MGFNQLGSKRTSQAEHDQNLGRIGIGMWKLYLRCIDHQPQCLQGHEVHFKTEGQAAAGWICRTVGRGCLLNGWWGIFPLPAKSWLPCYVQVWLEGGKDKQRAPASPWCVPQRCRNQRRSTTCCCTRSTAAPSRPSPRRCGSAAPPPPACRHRRRPRRCAGTWPSLKEPNPSSGLLCQCCWLPVGFLWWGWRANERSNWVSTNCWLTPQRREGWSTGDAQGLGEIFAMEEVGFFALGCFIYPGSFVC